MSELARFNGAPAGDLAFHRGLHYGDGVFRTCLIYKSEVIDLKLQIEKLKADAARLDLVVPSAIESDAAALAAGQASGVLKMIVMRADRGRGYRAAGRESDRLLVRYDAPRFPEATWQRGIALARAALRLSSQPALAGIKHLNRLEQVIASHEWPGGIDEIILADEQDRPIGGSRTNLFWVRDRSVHTPALDRCGVAGMMRSKVLRVAQASGLSSQAVAASWQDLDAADEVFVTNSLIGIWPVARLGDREWRAPGPVTAELMRKLAHPRLVES